ncbi:thiamine pyrophosphate-binding protein [Diaminobutyricimonas sp. LJ205]|uniref:thiamine pyrophosphate-binding protein n=1 Tax=Diaminobutyricimonas sp. LJ205 TaxID=2683590 RepID=UPI0012F4C3A1|nr:thiamine pyrophosphate-binding protein [Diaminobutyricimonas sp. LJ205]
MKLHAALAEFLRSAGVDSLFGLIGDGNLFFVDSYVREHGGRYVSVAHETAAVLAALGFARVSGRVGVATVTHGPALTNTVTALIEGARARLPIVLIAGDTARIDESNLQNVPQRAVAAVAEAPFVEIRSADTWQSDVRRAFRIAAVESRPVVLNVPIELMWADVAIPTATGSEVSRFAPPPPREQDLDDALGIIGSSRRPLVLAGRGGIEAREQLIRLAELLGAPLATTLGAKDLFRGMLADVGVFGGLSSDAGVQAIAASDCVIAFGASLNGFTTEHDTLLKGKRVVVCDVDASRARSDIPGAVLVGGDAAEVARAMCDLIEEAEILPTTFRAGLAAIDGGEPAASGAADTTLDIMAAYRAMDELLPPEHILVTDGGRFLPLAWKSLHIEHPRKLVPTIHFGSIGLGMGYAIGAAAAAPDTPVTLVTGDGGHMLGGYAEFTTAIRHGLDITVIVMNDGGYGAEWVQFEARGMDPKLSLLPWPEFAAVAEAAGAQAFSVASVDALRSALTTVRAPGPRLIDIRLDPAAIPNALH